MGSIVSIIAAILCHTAALSGYALRGFEAPWALPVLAGLPYGFAWLSRSSGRAGHHKRAQRWVALTESSGAIAFGALVLGLGWLDTVRRFTGDALTPESWPGEALGASLLPFVLYQLCAIDASVRAHGGTPATRRHLRAFQVRMFVAFIVPLLLFISVSAAVGRSDWMRAQVEHVGLASALFTGLFVIGMALMLPRLITWSWDTAPFPEGPQKDLLESVATRAEFQPRALRLWRTGHLIANATIIGARRGGHVVLFSDQLLSVLNSRELCAVYGHEIGHAKRGHVVAFLAWTAAFFFIGEAATVEAMEAYGDSAGVAVGAAFAAAWFFTFGWLSRRFELEADLFSLETVGDLQALVSALERVGGSQPARNGWRHFSVHRRVHFLGRAAADEPFVARFRARLGVFTKLGLALAALGAALQLNLLLADLPADRTVASIARGHYQRAKALSMDLEGPDAEDLRALAAAAAEIEGRTPADAARALSGVLSQEPLRGGDDPRLDRALALAKIMGLRGVPGAADAEEVLGAAADGRMSVARRGARRMRGPRSAELRRFLGEPDAAGRQ